MSLVALGVFILACGWNVYRDFLPTRTTAIRVEGHPQHFGAVIASGYLFLIAVCLHTTALRFETYDIALEGLTGIIPRASDDSDKKPAVAPEAAASKLVIDTLHLQNGNIFIGPQVEKKMPVLLAKPVPAHKPLNDFQHIVAVAIWSGLLAILLPFALNWPYVLNSRLRRLTALSNLDEVEQIMLEAFADEVSLAVTLSSGKVYIGVPLDVDPGPREKKWIRLLPLASGYRTDEGELIPTTAYEPVYDALSNNKNARLQQDDFRVLLSLQSIVSIQKFDLEFYIEHFASRPEDGENDELERALKAAIGIVESESAVVTQPSESKSGEIVAQSNTEESVLEVLPISYTFSDRKLRVFGRAYLIFLTLGIVMLPFSLTLSLGCAAIVLLAVLLVYEPVEVNWWALVTSVNGRQ